MLVLQWSKTQIMSLMILMYVGILYIFEGNRLNRVTQRSNCNWIYSMLYIVSEIAVLFDGITACTVNYTEQVPRTVNLLLHLGMFLSYQLYVALLFLYWISVTVGIPKKKWVKAAYMLPAGVSMLLTIIFLPETEFLAGAHTNFSMGRSVYISFLTSAVYCVLTVAVIIANHSYIQKRKQINIYTSLVFVVAVMSLQIIFPEYLVTCIAVVMATLSIYLNMENPSILELEHYHREMVMGFATLVENKDDNTGGHIRRSSAYALLIAKNLRKDERYKKLITKDYLSNLEQAAPMHDVGKVGIPDAILQKPGKLTDEEYEKMKEHPSIGGKIIKDTFGHLYNNEYESMAFQVAMYHHEKWNGRGYPTGMSGTDIPLCARIMAVADVFDAVSAKRCYRDAMPLEECYSIIMKGRGEDFDPDIVDAFMKNKDKIEEIYYSKNNVSK
ncbi:MAG: HD-GYP domain-containing protein [Oscillospiraceae bacterium]